MPKNEFNRITEDLITDLQLTLLALHRRPDGSVPLPIEALINTRIRMYRLIVANAAASRCCKEEGGDSSGDPSMSEGLVTCTDCAGAGFFTVLNDQFPCPLCLGEGRVAPHE